MYFENDDLFLALEVIDMFKTSDSIKELKENIQARLEEE